MSLKKASGARRAVLPRASDRTKVFVKDWTRLSHSGRYDMKRLKEVMLLLIANDAPLGSEWLDHPLAGDWADHRECHVGGDFLLIYRLGGAGAAEQITDAADKFVDLDRFAQRGHGELVQNRDLKLVDLMGNRW